jgi:hypothetical protein
MLGARAENQKINPGAMVHIKGLTLHQLFLNQRKRKWQPFAHASKRVKPHIVMVLTTIYNFRFALSFIGTIIHSE